MLNVSFLVPELRREFGGCAGNIAYNLKLLGGEPLIMATVGDDFGAYADRLDAHAISRDYIAMLRAPTPPGLHHHRPRRQQITAFHPGAMNYSHENDVRLVRTSSSASSRRTVATACCATFAASRSRRAVRLRPGRACAVHWRGTAGVRPQVSYVSSTTTKPNCCKRAPGKSGHAGASRRGADVTRGPKAR